jgi:hypothetical protein
MSERDYRRGPSDRERAQRVRNRRKAHRTRNRVPAAFTVRPDAFAKLTESERAPQATAA